MSCPWVLVNDEYEINAQCDDVPTLHLQTEMNFVSKYSEICYNADDALWVRCESFAIF